MTRRDRRPTPLESRLQAEFDRMRPPERGTPTDAAAPRWSPAFRRNSKQLRPPERGTPTDAAGVPPPGGAGQRSSGSGGSLQGPDLPIPLGVADPFEVDADLA